MFSYFHQILCFLLHSYYCFSYKSRCCHYLKS
uniref:Uncharacterized protein n=1 Tax=Arundo donax TaxID=35708 RepID=A0A0A9CGN8_ARUDO